MEDDKFEYDIEKSKDLFGFNKEDLKLEVGPNLYSQLLGLGKTLKDFGEIKYTKIKEHISNFKQFDDLMYMSMQLLGLVLLYINKYGKYSLNDDEDKKNLKSFIDANKYLFIKMKIGNTEEEQILLNNLYINFISYLYKIKNFLHR